ncbi:hypothetical protein BU15DRAFT_88844 [Melanogaster broomeanus]|nr:hypothetical protein BU15DRAFT_88844 [Melanogaster broomeanus]
MEEVRGVERGSYIWGRSVHNIRIERLWVDVTSGLGLKWKQFFQTLEAYDGLDINNQAHMWLLHDLFLPSINKEAEQWVAAWNHHVIGRRGEHHLSPHAMFLDGVLECGQRSIFVNGDTDDIGEIEEYGIDWNDLDNHQILRHHNNHNPEDTDEHAESGETNPFVLNHPDQLSHVEVPDTSCPFSSEELNTFHQCLQPLLDHTNSDMQSRRLLWIEALAIATAIIGTEQPN